LSGGGGVPALRQLQHLVAELLSLLPGGGGALHLLLVAEPLLLVAVPPPMTKIKKSMNQHHDLAVLNQGTTVDQQSAAKTLEWPATRRVSTGADARKHALLVSIPTTLRSTRLHGPVSFLVILQFRGCDGVGVHQPPHHHHLVAVVVAVAELVV